MVSDRDMVIGMLDAVKHEINDFTKAAMEVSNPNLRQTFLKYRDQAEQTQQQLAQFATSQGWYIPPPQATPQDIQQIRSGYEQLLMQTTR
ncbi:MAG: spore coat protein [Limnochordia bacterium]|jgi:spore coat protein CotF